MTNIFISSTYIDCIEYRNAAIEAIHTFNDNNISIIGMELFGSRKETTLEVCINEVKKADIYILIIAHRYGSIDKESQKSYTQLEYEEAAKKDIPILVYFLDNNVPILPDMIDKNRNYNRLKKFKKHLANKHTYQTFRDNYDLKHKILLDLKRELNQEYILENKIDLEDMNLTPNVYNHHEYEIDFIINDYFYDISDIHKLNLQIVENLNLAKGNTLFVNIIMFESGIRKEGTILICQNSFASWLKNIVSLNQYRRDNEETGEEENDIFRAKVKYVFTTYKEEDFSGDDIIYLPEEYCAFVLLEMPKKVDVYRRKMESVEYI